MSSDEEGDELISDILGGQALSSNWITTIQHGIQKIITSFPTISSSLDNLGLAGVLKLVQLHSRHHKDHEGLSYPPQPFCWL